MAPPIDLIAIFAASPAVASLAGALDAGRRVGASGAVGSSTALVAAAVARRTQRPVVLVVAHIDDADEAIDELLGAGAPAMRLPAMEVLPGETDVSLDLFAERLSMVRRALLLPQAQAGDANTNERTAPPVPVFVCPVQALMQAVPAPSRLESLSRTLSRAQTHDFGELVRWLDSSGYRRADAIEEPGDFAVRGGILDVFPPGGAANVPVRLDFFGDQIDRITEIDLETMGSDRAVETVELVCADAKPAQAEGISISFLELLPRYAVVVLAETREIVEQARGYYERLTDARGVFGPPAVLKLLQERFHALAEVNQFSTAAAAADVRVELPVSPLPEFSRDASEAVRELASMAGPPEAAAVLVACQNEGEHQRFGELMTEFAPDAKGAVRSMVAYVHRGFVWRGEEGENRAERAENRATSAENAHSPDSRFSSSPDSLSRPLALVPYHELLHRYHTRRGVVRLKAGRAMDTFLELQVGDFVVHTEHGIARFVGLKLEKPRQLPGAPALRAGPGSESRTARGPEPEEYLTLEFAGRSKLHVPATKIDQIQKYIGGFSGKPPLSTLGGQRWKSQKEKTAESVKDLAAEMLRVRAAREHMPGIRYPADTAWQTEFEAEFPYEETEDQLSALAAIKRDMQHEQPMDRLICGDVGFGKTEVAIRAAFKACEFGKQVAVLVPTTVLCEQHERTFKSRFSGYPFRVESISRFKTDAQVNEVLDALRKGRVDLIIGTHRLLSSDVRFADLGLVVVDEEQRFGVEHKERLLRLRLTVDVLTLSATPIPRTLHMAMLGLRDISSLVTAPLDRRAVVTEVVPYSERRIAEAIKRELSRDGQIFFVHNRVHNIKAVAAGVQRLAPTARIVTGHGQMAPRELEGVMLRFMRRQADILVSTTIIESGLDIPTANTMFINDADRFGLAELHQLRGRVGRYKHRAYCYLLLPLTRTIGEVGLKRLKAIEQYSMLGAGFKIAMRDLEIRGAGNLLGAEQSGHIAAVGYEMYCQLLDDAVRELKHERVAPPPSATSIEIGLTGVIPKPYIPSDTRRLEAYRRIATAATPRQLEQIAAELEQAYGKPPKAVSRLLDLAELRIAAAALDVRALTIRAQDVVFRTANAKPLAEKLHGAQGTVTVLAPKKDDDLAEVYYRPPANYLTKPDTLLHVLRKRLGAAPSVMAKV